MKTKLFVCGAILVTAMALQADSITVGTPGDANLNTNPGPSPNFGGTPINFDSTVTCTVSACATLTVSGVTFSSPDGVLVIPFSTQSYPNELYDNSSNGTANLSLLNTVGRGAIGVGIADSDPVTITIQALNAAGNPFGTAFTETIPENTVNPGNGYYVVSDTTADIYGLQITQSTGNANYSGLAIDDVQMTPEPSTYLLLISGAALLFALRKRLHA